MFKNNQRRLLFLTFVILIPIIFVGDVIFTHNSFTMRFPGGNDSIASYVGARMWLFEGISPYDHQVELRTESLAYGSILKPDEQPLPFYYPFYTIFFYIPLAFLTWDWVQAIGIVTLEFMVMLITIFSMRMYKWNPPALVLFSTFIFSMTWYHAVRTIFLVQFAGVAAFLIVLGLWAIKQKYEILGGVTLALATTKPQMVFLLLPLIAIWGLFNKRWRLVISISVMMILLWGVSFLLLPTWISDFLKELGAYLQDQKIGSPLNILTTIVFPGLGSKVEIGLICISVAWLFWEWWQVKFDQDSKRLDWVIALTLVITNIIVIRTATTNYVMLVPALFFIFKTGVDRFGGKANYWIVAAQFVLGIGLWALFIYTVRGIAEQWPVYLPLPLVLLAAIIFFKPKHEILI